MISYPYIEELFKAVLAKSNAVQGRFIICPNNGRELNSDELGNLISDEFKSQQMEKKYPLAAMMPPISSGNYSDAVNEWEQYRCSIFFLNTVFYSGTNQVVFPNASTQTSKHTVVQTWHDMKRAAVNFVRAVDRVSRKRGLIRGVFRVAPGKQHIITPVTKVGADLSSGVRLDMSVELFTGCTIEDYTESEILNINLPEGDSHPEHTL